MNDVQFMLHALELSKKALPNCIPNPPVGCVLVKDGEVVAEGFTQVIGGNHAEVEAINQLPGSLDNVIAYVTLEPCAFEGRTPSCAKMIASLGLTKVVVAITDPDPRNAGKGIEILRSNGVTVEVGVAKEEVEQFITKYLGKS
jgi:pyrimidine deaminase RibD-like protein